MVKGLDDVSVRDGVVTKVHGGDDGSRRAARSAAAMRAARAAGLPVPVVVAVGGRELRTSHLSTGAPGIVALRDDPVEVLVALGRLAARLHAMPPPEGIPVVDRRGVWVHGDLCPVNVFVAGGEVTGVVDWEDTRVDDPLVDLVWSEWLVRTFHPAAAQHLGALYDSYGAGVPSASRRRGVMRALLVRRRDVERDPAPWRLRLDSLDDLVIGITGRGRGGSS